MGTGPARIAIESTAPMLGSPPVNLLYGVPLVTHNRGDYRGVPGLTVISQGE
jgi:hypothetical protein